MGRLIALAVAAALVAADAPAQGLAEAAAREKRRREEEQKKKGPAKVVTTEDLANTTGTVANAAAPVLAQDKGRKQSSDSTSSEEPDPVGRPRVAPSRPEGAEPERGGHDQKTWKTLADEARAQLGASEEKLRALEEENGRLFGEMQRSTDTNEIMRLRGELKRVSEQVEFAKQEVANARQELAAFEESARRAGVPAGWIR
jgi:hypothetical protein